MSPLQEQVLGHPSGGSEGRSTTKGGQKKMKVALYCRVSTVQQKEEGKSLDAQYESCLAKAKELGYQPDDVCVLKEAWSGLDLYRPQLSQLREWIRNREIEALVVCDTHRLRLYGKEITA